MYETTYHRPSSVDEAARLLSANPEAKLLAGGMTLLPTMKLRLAAPSDIVDIGRIAELKQIREEGGAVVIGAGATHYAVANDATVKSRIPTLASLAESIGDPHVRYMGTIGGSVANNDPAADYPSALVALGATVVTNRRKVEAEAFFTGMFETALDEGEIVTAVSFPVPRRAGYAKLRNPASHYPMAGVFVAERSDGGVRVAVIGAGPCVFRVEAMERALASDFSEAAIAGISVPADGLNSDIHGAADYRAHLVTVMARRAVASAR